MSNEDGEQSGHSPRLVGGAWLLGLSFIPWLAMLTVVAVPGTRAKLSWLSVLLIVLSNVMWYLGILLIGPDVYRTTKKRWRARWRIRKERSDDADTGGTGSDRVGEAGAPGDGQ